MPHAVGEQGKEIDGLARARDGRASPASGSARWRREVAAGLPWGIAVATVVGRGVQASGGRRGGGGSRREEQSHGNGFPLSTWEKRIGCLGERGRNGEEAVFLIKKRNSVVNKLTREG